LQSGTSIGANIEESTAAQSANDFIHKLSIASKEARESKYWLMLLQQSKLVDCDYSIYLKEIDEIINILTSIIKTMQDKNRK
jgi:four helix bundle protein